MTEYRRVETSAEVWAVIMARHHADLVVFSSATFPEGTWYGDRPYIFTAWGFNDGACPIMEAETRWEGEDEKGRRINEVTTKWLCIPLEDKE